MPEIKNAVVVYLESTPNPASMKFVADRLLLKEGSVEYTGKDQALNCPLAFQMFDFAGVASVFIASNFVTITKHAGYEWFDIQTILREFIKGFLESGEKVFTGEQGQKADPSIERTHTASAIETKIIETLEEYVKPAVEQDGGAIHFKSYDQGVVTLILKGSCSGCPSSTQTLKGGIENLLKRLIPEVHEVIAEAQ
jgi:Fe-S cluster biogenesis protein NfuA